MGEALAGRQLGKKAMLIGIIAHSLPDIDFISSLWLNTADHLLAHRGLTHSIFFVLLVSPVLAILAKQKFKKESLSYGKWLTIFVVPMALHILLDAFNNYGVGWFEPFSSQRISFNIIYVADPFFSILPGIATAMLIIIKQGKKTRQFWWKAGLSFSFLYLFYCSINKININSKVEKLLDSQSISAKRFITTPAPLQNWLWFVAAQTDSGYYTGYVSVFDSKQNTPLYYFPQNKSLLNSVTNKEEAEKLIQFSQGYYTLEKHADTILFNDLRFGQVTGWYDPKQRFAFYFYLQPEMDNTLAVQRGRFANWNRKTFRSFIQRIKGN
jgi:inner membrane protein